MAKFDFPLEMLPDSTELVPLADLTRALRTKNSSDRDWMAPPIWRKFDPMPKRYVTARSPRAEHIWKTELESDAQMLAELQMGLLLSHVMVAKNAVRAIPPEFWLEQYAHLSVGGTLFDMTHGSVVPCALIGGRIAVFEEHAFRWLLDQGINADNPDYPRGLRKGVPPKKPALPHVTKIRAKMLELMSNGYTKNDAAKRIGLLPGFRGVENLDARRAVEGIGLKPGRRPKKG